MAEIKFEYQSVKDYLPKSDNKFYDVMVILYNTSVEGGYGYYRGKYQNGFFFIENGIYKQESSFVCSWTQKKVIAWKPLEMCTKKQIDTFILKANGR